MPPVQVEKSPVPDANGPRQLRKRKNPDAGEQLPHDTDSAGKSKKKRATSDNTSDESAVEDADDEFPDTTAVASDGMLADLGHIEEPEVFERVTINPTADVDYFFDNKQMVVFKNEKRIRMSCVRCRAKGAAQIDYAADVTTRRRHMEAEHRAEYLKYCKEKNFESKLPKDVKRRKDEEATKHKQGTLDVALAPMPRVTPYSDAAFLRATTRFIVDTNQSLRITEESSFKDMIDLAARAKNGVTVPSRKTVRKDIITCWKESVASIKEDLKNSEGRVSLTCDCFEAVSGDAYFAVTAHYIASIAGTWELKSALIGFVQLNNSHTGVRLGQALYKVCCRIGIERKIGHVTCDNASNNNTMIGEFARLLNLRLGSDDGGEEWDPNDNHVRCLAHIINLAVQAMIKTESSAKHYNPHDPVAHLPTSTDDAVGIIRAISVKARSSSQRKEKFRQIIIKLNTKTMAANAKAPANGLSEAQLLAIKELLLDMTVRWSSTFHMNHRAYELRPAVDAFTRYLIKSETNAAKIETLKTLRMSEEKWTHVGTFCKLLQLADDAQQEFSSSRYPSLQLALPTIERLHLNYSSRLERAQYIKFKPAIQKAMEVLETYNERTSDSHAYTMMMVLDPRIKFSWFRDHWSPKEYDAAVVSVRAIFKQRYIRMYGSETHVTASTQKMKMSRKLSRLINVSDDEDVAGPTIDRTTGWEAAYNAYAQVHDEVLPSDGLVVTYWGANKLRLPVWAGLAADYLAVMASSVSSERVFSQAGLVITKRRTLLKADIVEAIQMVKYRLKEDTCLELYDAVPSLCVEETLARIEEEDRQVMEDLKVPADLCLVLDDVQASGDELSDVDTD